MDNNETEKVTVSNYQKLAMKTCIPSCANMTYCTYGLISEMHELLGKYYGLKAKSTRGDFDVNNIPESKRDAVKGELGDVCWFIALYCDLNNDSFEAIEKNEESSFPWNGVAAAKFLDIFGLDDCIKEIDRSMIENYMFVVKYIAYACNIKFDDILEYNIKKLASREKRSLIKGDGDFR